MPGKVKIHLLEPDVDVFFWCAFEGVWAFDSHFLGVWGGHGIEGSAVNRVQGFRVQGSGIR
jgi:hypothetical protein